MGTWQAARWPQALCFFFPGTVRATHPARDPRSSRLDQQGASMHCNPELGRGLGAPLGLFYEVSSRSKNTLFYYYNKNLYLQVIKAQCTLADKL